jgi:hypothetical protein
MSRLGNDDCVENLEWEVADEVLAAGVTRRCIPHFAGGLRHRMVVGSWTAHRNWVEWGIGSATDRPGLFRE